MQQKLKIKPSLESWNKLLGFFFVIRFFFKCPKHRCLKLHSFQLGLCRFHLKVDVSHIALYSGYAVSSVLLGFYDKGWKIVSV